MRWDACDNTLIMITFNTSTYLYKVFRISLSATAGRDNHSSARPVFDFGQNIVVYLFGTLGPVDT